MIKPSVASLKMTIVGPEPAAWAMPSVNSDEPLTLNASNTSSTPSA